MTNIRNHTTPLDPCERKVLSIVAQRLAQYIPPVNIQMPKGRARARKHIIVQGDDERYLVELAKNSIQKFYLKRSIYYLKFFRNKIKYATIKLPVLEDEIDGVYFAVFLYLKGQPGKPDFSGEWILNSLYENFTHTRKVSTETITDIGEAYLASWPGKYHFHIQNLPEYAEYLEQY